MAAVYLCFTYIEVSVVLQTRGYGNAESEIGQLTDDEDRDNDDEDQRHILTMFGTTTCRRGRRHLLMSATSGVKCSDKEHVQYEQCH